MEYLSGGYYCELQQQWIEGAAYSGTADATVRALSLMTCRMPKDDQLSDSDLQRIGLSEGEPPIDIVALRNVSPATLAELLHDPFVQQHYHVSDTTCASVFPNGVVILSRFPLHSLKMVRLPGGEDSKLLSAEVRLKEASLRLGLVSFESSSVGPADVAEQLLTVVELMRDADNCLLMGDFGATTQFGGIELEQANFRDLWAESFGKAGPESGQFVEHPGSSFPRTVASGWEQNDRFFVRSARDRIRPETVVLAPLVRAGGQRESRRRTNATMLYGLHAKVRVGTDEVRKSKTSVRGERPRHKRQNGPVLRLIRGRACNNMSDTTES